MFLAQKHRTGVVGVWLFLVEHVRQLRLAFMFPLSCVRSGRAVRRAAAKFICCDAVSAGLTVPPYRDKRAMRLDRIRRFRDDCN